MGMTQRQNIRHPQPGEIPHTAGEYLYTHGSCTEAELFLAVNFGATQSARNEALQRAIRGGWLMETSRGKIACSPAATDYYDEQSDKPAEKYVGQIVPAATRDVFASPGLSKKYQINSRGSRLDIPSWSVRENVSFHTKA
jgi:hypothetical protein